MTATAVYTCSIGNHDWIHRPRVKPPGIHFLRFSDRKPLLTHGWTHCSLPPVTQARTARASARFAKVRPHVVLSGIDFAIWIDSSVEVLGDLRLLLQSFIDSDADIALFPHPSGRTVVQELDFCLKLGKIGPSFHVEAERQRERYAAAGVLDEKVVESTIIFYRLSSEALRAAGEAWWAEIAVYTERDQVSQPFAMRNEAIRIHYWDWHFDDPNPYFRRVPHRPKNFAKRLRTGAHFLAESRLDYRIARYMIGVGGSLRHMGRSLFATSK